MLTRDNITITQLLEHIPALRFRLAADKTKIFELDYSEEKLYKLHEVRTGQIITVDLLKFIVIGANHSDLWVYGQDEIGITALSTLGSSIKKTSEFAPLLETISAVYASSNIAKYLDLHFKISRYRLQPVGDYASVDSSTEIASGYDGEVHAVFVNDQKVACKVLKKKYNRFSNELNVLRMISDLVSHQYLMTLKYFAIDPTGHEQLFFEYMNMGDLESYWLDKDNYSPESCYRIFYNVICGLNELHEARFVHRDVKPGNIYLQRDQRDIIHAKLGDFGFSLPLHLLKGQEVAGTPLYFAPELIENYRFEGELEKSNSAQMSNYSTDIYAYGMSVCHIVEAVDPYPHAKIGPKLRDAIVKGAPKHNVTTDDPKPSIKLISIFGHCTASKPSDRPTAKEVKNEFSLGPDIISDAFRKYAP